MSAELEELEEALLESDDEAELPPSDIVAYSELRSCADIYRMYEDGFLDLAPDFQREEVWGNTSKTRFVDSLIKQLPIPSLCFAYDYKTEKRQVIDGLQRVSTIVRFLGPASWTLSRLDDIDSRISGTTNEEFRKAGSALAPFYRRVQNATLPITVLRCDLSQRSHQSYLFTIFHRLNTGGMKLNNQEIRNCIYQGPLNSFLRERAASPTIRKMLGFDARQKTRFKVEEVLLRFLAFFDRLDEYRGRLARFLNEYMSEHRVPSAEWLDEKAELVSAVESIVARQFPSLMTGRRRSLAVVEAVLVGTARNLSQLSADTAETAEAKLVTLLNHEEFSDSRLRGGLADADRVKGRLTAAIAILGA